MHLFRAIAVVSIAAVLLGSSLRDDVVPMDVQFPLLLKILTFERDLAERAGDEIVIGVVYQERVRQSWLVKEEFIHESRTSLVRHIHDIPIRVATFDLEQRADVGAFIAREHVDVLYVAPLRATDVGGVAAAARAQGVVTMTGVPDYVAAGVCLGVGLSGGKPQILINLRATTTGGSNFHAQLLRIATLITDESR